MSVLAGFCHGFYSAEVSCLTLFTDLFDFFCKWQCMVLYPIIIITSCHLLGDIGHQQNTAIWSYFQPSSLTSFQLFPFSNASLWTVLCHVLCRSPSPTFPLRVPIQGLTFDGFISFPHCMSYLFPLLSLALCGHLDFCSSPKFFIRNHFQPMDVQDSS